MPRTKATPPPSAQLPEFNRQEQRLFQQICNAEDRKLIVDKFLGLLEGAENPTDVSRLLNSLSNYEDELADLDRAQQSAEKPDDDGRDPAGRSEDLPAWLVETPKETEYCLEMFADDGKCTQEVGLTRTEYEALKRQLAVMRGYTLPEEGRA